MRRAVAALLLLGVGLSLSGCIWYGPPAYGSRWCYYHPHRCPPPP